MQRLVVAALAPDADLVEARGEWLLFESNHDVDPILSPGAPPDPRMETLAARVTFVARQSQTAPP